MQQPFFLFRYARLTGIGLLTALLTLAVQAAKVTHVSGLVQIERDSVLQSVHLGQSLTQGDRLVTAADGESLIHFDDDAQLVLRPGSDLIVRELPDWSANRKAQRRAKTLRLIKGGLRYISNGGRKLHQVRFESSTVSVGIRGTDIELQITEQAIQDINPGTFLKVNSGAADLTTMEGTRVAVFAGDIAWGGEPELTTRSGRPPRPSARLVRLDMNATVFKGSPLEQLLRKRP